MGHMASVEEANGKKDRVKRQSSSLQQTFWISKADGGKKMYIVGADALLSLSLKKPDEDRMKAVSAARKAQREQSTGITDHFILQILHQ